MNNIAFYFFSTKNDRLESLDEMTTVCDLYGIHILVEPYLSSNENTSRPTF